MATGGLFEISAYISMFIVSHRFLWDVITHPCTNLIGGLVKWIWDMNK